jgi:hypothetical protein
LAKDRSDLRVETGKGIGPGHGHWTSKIFSRHERAAGPGVKRAVICFAEGALADE